MGLDELKGFLQKKRAVELITEVGTRTATSNTLVDAVAVNGSTTSSRLSEGVEHEVLTVSHKPTEHETEKQYTLMILERRIYNRAAQAEFERRIRKPRRVQHEHETAFKRVIGKLNRDMGIHEMVTGSEPVEDQEIDLSEGASLAPKMTSGEKLHEAKRKRMEANLKSIEELKDADGTREDSS